MARRADAGRAAAVVLALLTVILLLLGWGAWWVWRVRQRFRAPLERGQELLEQRRLDEAIASFELARAAQPNDPAPVRGLATCYLRSGKLPAAAALAEEAIALDTSSPAARVLAAEIALARAGPWDPFLPADREADGEKRKQLGYAARLAQEAAERHPDCGSAHRLLAEAAARLGDLAKAVTHIRQALKLEPESRPALLTAIDVFIRGGKPHEALEECHRVAQQLAPLSELEDRERSNLLRALSRGGRLAADLGMGEQAVAFWRKFLDGGGDRGVGHVGLVIGNYVKGDYEQAIEDGNRAMRYMAPTAPSWELHYYRGLAFLNTKRYDRAVHEFRIAGTVRPDPRAQHALATALLRDGARDEARDALLETLDLDPRHAAALQDLVGLYEADGELKAALDRLTRAVAAMPEAREPLELKAGFCLRHGRDDDAEEALRALYRVKPPSPSAAAALAAFYLERRDDPEQALLLAREAMALEPASAEFLHLVGRIEGALGRCDEAESHFAQALRLEPKRAEAYVDWAAALEAAGDRAGAEEVYARARKALPTSSVVRYAYARFCIAVGRADEGLGELGRVLGTDPEGLAARHALVDHFLARGEREAALMHARDAVEAFPKSIEAHRLLAGVHRARGEWDKVFAILVKAGGLPGGELAVLPEQLAAGMRQGFYNAPTKAGKEQGGGRARARKGLELVMAISWFFAGSRAEATAEVGRVASGDRHDCDAGFILSLMQLAAGQPVLRAPACKEFALPAVALRAWRDLAQPKQPTEDPEAPTLPERGSRGSPYKELAPQEVKQIVEALLHAYVYERAGWHDTAAEEMERVLKIVPDCLFACCMAPVLWERAGKRAKAIEACERALKQRKGFQYGRLLLADLLLVDGKVNRAKALYAECAAGEKAPFEAGTKLALLATLTGDEEGAIEAWRAIVREEPLRMPACNNLAWLLATSAEPQIAEARAAAQNTQAAAGEDPAALDTAGWVSHLAGDSRGALKALEKAAGLAPHRATVLFHLGMAYAREGQAAKAKQTLEAAVDLAPRAPLADRARQMLRDLRYGEDLAPEGSR